MTEAIRNLATDLSTYLPVILLLLGINLFVLWRRYRSRQELIQRIAELEGLSSAGRAIVAAQLDFDTLCDLIVSETDNVIDTRTFQLGFFDADYYHLQVILDQGERQPAQTVDLSDGRGLVRWVRDHKRSLLIRDFAREVETLPAVPYFLNDPPIVNGSALLIPLIHGEEAIGVLAAHSEQINHFTAHHERKLTILANQAAAAVANARLFKAERNRSAQVELIGRITHEINAIEDVDELFGQVVTLTQQTFGFFQVNIYGLTRANDHVVLQASSAEAFNFGTAHFDLDTGIVGLALQKGQTIVDNNVHESNIYVHQIGDPLVDAYWSKTQASVVVPLFVDSVIWGALEVLHDEVGAFSPQEIDVLEALASGVSTAIQKARQLVRQQEAAWLTAARLQIAELLNRSDELEGALHGVVRITPMLAGSDQCGLLLWESVSESYMPTMIHGVSHEILQRFQGGRWKIGDWSALDAVHIGHVDIETRRIPPWVSASAARHRSEDGVTYLLSPLHTGSKYMGVLFVNRPDYLPVLSGRMMLDDPDGPRKNLMSSIAELTAQTIERFDLQRAQEEEAWVNTALLQVADAVNRMIDLNEILSTIVRFVPMLVGVESCIVLTWDERNRVFVPGPSYGVTEMGRGILQTLELTEEESRKLLHDRPLQPEDRTQVEHYSLRMPHWLQQVLRSSEGHAVLLRSQGRVVGVMAVGLLREVAGRRREFYGRRLNILLGIAQQAATAVMNNRLYAEASARERLEQEIDVARRLQMSLIPSQDPAIPGLDVASHWRSARQVSGDFYDFFQLRDGRWGIAIADVADKGIPAALYMAVSRTILRAAADMRVDPAAILQRSNDLLISNTNADQFVSVFLGIWDHDQCRLDYACGGHNPPAIITAARRPQILQTTGPILGMLDNMVYRTASVDLTVGDVMVFYTDGVTEAINVNLDEFGLDRLCQAVRENKTAPAAEIVDSITDAVVDHEGGMPQSDDMTLVIAKVREPAEAT